MSLQMPFKLFKLALLFSLTVFASVALSQPAVTTNVRKSPPDEKIAVRGTAFGSSELVDIYFGTTDVVLSRVQTRSVRLWGYFVLQSPPFQVGTRSRQSGARAD